MGWAQATCQTGASCLKVKKKKSLKAYLKIIKFNTQLTWNLKPENKKIIN